jgi:hypothetical protein
MKIPKSKLKKLLKFKKMPTYLLYLSYLPYLWGSPLTEPHLFFYLALAVDKIPHLLQKFNGMHLSWNFRVF